MRALILRERDKLRVFAPYAPEFIDALKKRVPYGALRWKADDKNWLISDTYEDALLDVAGDHFEVDLVVSEDEAARREYAARASSASQQPPSSKPAHNAQQCLSEVRRIWREESDLSVLPDAPLEVVRAAYRALSKITHPDVNGSNSTAAMVRLNQAYELLTKRYASRSS